MNNPITVLFDLDGTLLDTVYDLTTVINMMRKELSLAPIPVHEIRPLIGYGARAIIQQGLPITEDSPQFTELRMRFFALYQKHLVNQTTFFSGIETVIDYLVQHHHPWGIVTNRLTQHTIPLLQALNMPHQPGCIICGDTYENAKPHPQPITEACKLLNSDPARVYYVGDAETDVQASRAAGTQSLVALYGYISENENPRHWQADGYIEKPEDILTWL